MLTGYEFLEAAYMAKMMSGGGSVKIESMFDYISKLPSTGYSFDIADEWWCEMCADSNPTTIPWNFGTGSRRDDWSAEYTSAVTVSTPTKAFYLRIFKGSELKMVTNERVYNSLLKLYASNGTDVGDLKEVTTFEYDFSSLGVASVGGYNTNMLNMPYVYLKYKATRTTNGEVVSEYSSTIGWISPSVRYFMGNNKTDSDINVYADFVKAVRKMSDEYNKTKEVIK